MKKLFYFLSLGIIAGMMMMTSCKDDPDEQLTAQQEQAQLLAGIWTQQNTTQLPQGVDPTILDQLTFTFGIDANKNPSSFSSGGAPDFFTTSGSSEWAFSGSSTTSLILSEVSPVSELTINSLTATSLTVSFSLTSGGVRVASLDGNYTVEMTK
ncbi:MAG: hypothetical protein KFF73_09765 [Cyclobacteriaceae bacterium]|nr:hypothetical protein [Cyclobacteriaceae bacterium]